MEIKTDSVKPYHITGDRVREFGAATKDFNKFHEDYAYGSQITGWIRHTTNSLLALGGLELQCATQESRFSAIPIPIGSKLKLPETVTVDYDDREKQACVSFDIHFENDPERKKIVEATFVYRATLPSGRADLTGKPQKKYGLKQGPAELVASALERTGADLDMLAFGYASPTLQENSHRIIREGELPIFLGQKIEFYSTEQPLQAGDNVYIAIINARRRKGLGGGEKQTTDMSVIDLTTTKGSPQNGEILTKVKFVIGIIGQEQSIERAVTSAGAPKANPSA